LERGFLHSALSQFRVWVNSDAFERLARSLPFRIIRKQRISITQVESLLFGQAGMLEETDIDCYHYKLLRREYQFLRHKYQLTPLDESLFKNLRIRPNYSPILSWPNLQPFGCSTTPCFR
jgi:Protein of unknown function (DUF2851).